VQDLFSIRLKGLREESGITMVELAGVLGMSQATISEWEKGNKFPRAGALQGLAHYFDVPMEYFFKEEVFLAAEMVNISLHTTISQRTLTTIDDFSDEKVKYIKLPISFLGPYSKEETLHAFVVPGDSMNHLFPKGSTIIVKRIDCADVIDGDVIVYFSGEDYAIGRFRKNEADKVYLLKPESTNPLHYDVVIPFEENHKIEGIAKVIWYGVSV